MDDNKEIEVNVDDSKLNKADLPKEGDSNKSEQSGRHGRGRGRGRKDKDKCGDPKKKGMNDPSFYYDEVQILNDMASIPTAYATGLPVRLQGSKWVNPGVRVLYTRPILPLTKGADDSINAAAVKQFAFFRATVSSKLPYEPQDLVLYEIAAASTYSFAKWCDRIYSTATSLYVNENRYTPRTLLQVQGVSPDDMTENLAKFRGWLNIFKNKARALNVPATLKYFKRMSMVYESYYTEGESVKDQLYMYTPMGFWMYSDMPASGSTGSWLKYVPLLSCDVMDGTPMDSSDLFSTQLLTVSDIIKYGNKMINALYAAEDVAIMSSNIQRAYGEASLVKLDLTPDFPVIVPVYDINVLEQMQNATILPLELNQYIGKSSSTQRLNNWDIKQIVTATTDPLPAVTHLEFTPGLYKPTAASAFGTAFNRWYIDNLLDNNYLVVSMRPNMTPDVMLDITRMMVYGTSPLTSGSSAPSCYISGCTEVCVASVEYQLNVNNALQYVPLRTISDNLSYNYDFTWTLQQSDQLWDADSVADIINRYAMNSMFKFSHTEYAYYFETYNAQTKDAEVQPLTAVNGRIDNYTLIEQQDLENMNEMASYALFNVNSVVKAY